MEKQQFANRPRFDVELIAVTKRFAGVTAVDCVSLRIPTASYCCLLGPSGCGKTSTLRLIAGHETVSDGDMLIRDHNITGLPPAKRGTAMMFQNYALFPHLNCLDNVSFSLRMRGIAKAERHARAREFLQLVEMSELAERLPAQLSGGQQQRVALARAADHRAASATARRASIGSGSVPPGTHAGGIETATARTRDHLH
jgi:putative spermidine/putrescine transport system ATP-binding protein